eukprot:3216667-Pleurochrysis_carterae.AAC.3
MTTGNATLPLLPRDTYSAHAARYSLLPRASDSAAAPSCAASVSKFVTLLASAVRARSSLSALHSTSLCALASIGILTHALLRYCTEYSRINFSCSAASSSAASLRLITCHLALYDALSFAVICIFSVASLPPVFYHRLVHNFAYFDTPSTLDCVRALVLRLVSLLLEPSGFLGVEYQRHSPLAQPPIAGGLRPPLERAINSFLELTLTAPVSAAARRAQLCTAAEGSQPS